MSSPGGRETEYHLSLEMKEKPASKRGTGLVVLLAVAALAPACDGPIVARSPDALYALAQEQIAHGNYSPAVDTLVKIAREFPTSERGRQARVLQLALLGGMARGYQRVGEALLQGRRQAGEEPTAARLRTIAIDYFGRARGRSLELVEELDPMVSAGATGPWKLEVALPDAAGEAQGTLEQIRRGKLMGNKEMLQAEKEKILEGLAETLGALMGAGVGPSEARARLQQGKPVELEPARVYLALAGLIADSTSIFGPEALREPRMAQVYYERAAAAAARAAELAREAGSQALVERSQELERRCQEGLARLKRSG